MSEKEYSNLQIEFSMSVAPAIALADVVLRAGLCSEDQESRDAHLSAFLSHCRLAFKEMERVCGKRFR